MQLSLALSITSVLLGLSACCTSQSVTINDHTLYYQKQASDQDWAVRLHFLTQGTEDLTKAQWEALSEGQVCMPLSDWSDINKMVSNFCSSPHIDCSYELPQGGNLKSILNAFFMRLQMASGKTFDPID